MIVFTQKDFDELCAKQLELAKRIDNLADLVATCHAQQESLVTTLKVIMKISRDPAVVEICEAELAGR
jgi:hypothetical protein